MKRAVLIIGVVVLAACVLGLAYLFVPGWHSKIANTASVSPAIQGTPDNSVAEVPAPPLVNEYKNDTYRFSLSMPADFKAHEIPGDTAGVTVVIQNAQGDGIQILITPYPDDLHSITADDVRANIPDMKVTDDQIVEIGSDYTGVAFKSDNDAFGGASREVWFVFHKNLYQISTYARLDPLLKAMFGTWKFF